MIMSSETGSFIALTFSLQHIHYSQLREGGIRTICAQEQSVTENMSKRKKKLVAVDEILDA